MGIAGWDIRSASTQLVGTLQSHHYSGGGGIISFNDYDSNLQVLPASGYEHLAVNRSGVTNSGGLIECEVHVARNVPDTPTERDIFEPCVGRNVILTGPFVEDRSHNNKTEIHPIDSLLVDFGVDGAGRHARFCAFSDDWGWTTAQPTPPPFARLDRLADALIQFPQGPPGYVAGYAANVYPISAFQSADINVVPSADGHTYLHVLVHTGTPGASGFYWADYTLYWYRPKGKEKEHKDKEKDKEKDLMKDKEHKEVMKEKDRDMASGAQPAGAADVSGWPLADRE